MIKINSKTKAKYFFFPFAIRNLRIFNAATKIRSPITTFRGVIRTSLVISQSVYSLVVRQHSRAEHVRSFRVASGRKSFTFFSTFGNMAPISPITGIDDDQRFALIKVPMNLVTIFIFYHIVFDNNTVFPTPASLFNWNNRIMKRKPQLRRTRLIL